MRIAFTTATAVVLAALTLASSALAASTAKPLTGVWAGRTAQDLIGTDDTWSQRITVKALAGRLYSITAYVRAQCPVEGGIGAKDMLISESFGLKGPRLGKYGSFTVVISGVSFSGAIGKGSSSGRFDYSQGSCEGKGSWRAQRYS